MTDQRPPADGGTPDPAIRGRRRARVQPEPTATPAGQDADSGWLARSMHGDLAGEDSAPRGGQRKTSRSRAARGRYAAVVSLVALVALVGGCAGGYVWWLNSQLGNITRADMGVTEDPAKNHHESKRPLNILLLGADHGQEGQSVADDLADGTWTP